MKKVIFLIALVTLSISSALAQDFTSAQLRVRNEIKQFIAEEGYVPTIDSDGDIKFKKSGTTYYVIVSKSDTKPMYVRLICSYDYGETTYTRAKISAKLVDVSRFKGVKLALYDNTYAYEADMYLTSSKAFTDAFEKLIEQIESLSERLGELL